MQGYNDIRVGAAWLNVSARGKIRVAGVDRARLLHAMTTNHMSVAVRKGASLAGERGPPTWLRDGLLPCQEKC